VYLSRGLTGVLFRYTAVTAAVKITCIAVGSTWGIVGVAAGFALSHALEWPISLAWMSRRTGLPVRPLVLGALRILAVTGAVAAAGYGGTVATEGSPDAVRLIAGVACGAVAYVLLLVVVRPFRRDAAGIIDTVRMLAPGRRGSATGGPVAA
jgi:O-antigen/teichoic acid export membrane protein